MSDNEHIYDDLADDFQIHKAREQNEFVDKLARLQNELFYQHEQNEDLRRQNSVLSKKNAMMEQNFSRLLDTARTELLRKDIMIADLRREKDDILFRRKASTSVSETVPHFSASLSNVIVSSTGQYSSEYKPCPPYTSPNIPTEDRGHLYDPLPPYFSPQPPQSVPLPYRSSSPEFLRTEIPTRTETYIHPSRTEPHPGPSRSPNSPLSIHFSHYTNDQDFEEHIANEKRLLDERVRSLQESVLRDIGMQNRSHKSVERFERSQSPERTPFNRYSPSPLPESSDYSWNRVESNSSLPDITIDANQNDDNCDLREMLNRKNRVVNKKYPGDFRPPRWYDKELKETSEEKWKAYQQMKTTGAEEDVKAYKDIRAIMNRERRSKKMDFLRANKLKYSKRL